MFNILTTANRVSDKARNCKMD